MSLKDYEHWNEDAEYMWYMEEGRFGSEEPDYDPYDDVDNREIYGDDDED